MGPGTLADVDPCEPDESVMHGASPQEVPAQAVADSAPVAGDQWNWPSQRSTTIRDVRLSTAGWPRKTLDLRHLARRYTDACPDAPDHRSRVRCRWCRVQRLGHDETDHSTNAQDLADVVKVPCPDTAVNPTVTSTTPGSGSTPGALMPTYQELTIAKLGDQRMAAIFIGVESPQATWFIRSAMVRVGSVAMTLGLTEILTTPQDTPKISDAEFVHLVETAVAKLSS